MLDAMMKAGGGEGDTDTEREVLKQIIDLCKQAMGGSVGKRDSDLMSKLGGGDSSMTEGSKNVLSDKPGAKGSPEEEEEEKEYLKSFGGEE